MQRRNLTLALPFPDTLRPSQKTRKCKLIRFSRRYRFVSMRFASFFSLFNKLSNTVSCFLFVFIRRNVIEASDQTHTSDVSQRDVKLLRLKSCNYTPMQQICQVFLLLKQEGEQRRKSSNHEALEEIESLCNFHTRCTRNVFQYSQFVTVTKPQSIESMCDLKGK